MKSVKYITIINKITGEEITYRWVTDDDLFEILDNLSDEWTIKR